MPDVVGLRFKRCGKIYDFEVNGVEMHKGDLVVVESELGLNIGNVVTENYSIEDQEKKLKKIIRKATENDLMQKEENQGLETEARAQLPRKDNGTRCRLGQDLQQCPRGKGQG